MFSMNDGGFALEMAFIFIFLVLALFFIICLARFFSWLEHRRKRTKDAILCFR